jgi:hypothetical protein
MEKFGAAFALVVTVLALQPAAAQDIAPAGAVACITSHHLWNYADAVDRHDREHQRKLMDGECRNVEGKPYALLEEHNGTAKILLFRKPDDWETAEVFYTLDEMLQLE